MSYRGSIAFLALAGLVGSAAPAFAMSGLGCSELPAYYRAVGTVENGTGCGMSLEEARRILARQKGPADSPQYETVVPRQ